MEQYRGREGALQQVARLHEAPVGGRVDVPAVAWRGERRGPHEDLEGGPVGELLAPAGRVAGPPYRAQDLRQAERDHGRAAAARRGQGAAGRGGGEGAEAARHVAYLVRPPAVGAEVDQGEDVAPSVAHPDGLMVRPDTLYRRSPIKQVLRCFVGGRRAPHITYEMQGTYRGTDRRDTDTTPLPSLPCCFLSCHG